MNILTTQPLNQSLSFPQDLLSIPAFTLGWAVLHYMVVKFIAKPYGIILFPSKGKTSKDIKQIHQDRNKLLTAIWKFVYFGLCAGFGGYIFWSEPWSMNTKDYFFGWPNHEMSLAIKLYYNAQMGGYLYALLMMPFEPAQKVADYFVLLVHHGVTLYLLWTSYTMGFFRVGVVIAFLHDLSDPFMEIAKVALYSKRTKLADVLFALFAIVFMFTRNFIYPAYVAGSVHRHCNFPDGRKMPDEETNFWFQVTLWILEVLHVYWAILILRMVYKAIRDSGVRDDIRNVKHEKDE